MIQQPIPYQLGQYATFSDTLDTDDTTEELHILAPDGTTIQVIHAGLTRVVNADTSITYSWIQELDQHGQWVGEFVATGGDAGVANVQAYVAL